MGALRGKVIVPRGAAIFFEPRLSRKFPPERLRRCVPENKEVAGLLFANPFFSSQTFSAARRRLLVRERVLPRGAQRVFVDWGEPFGRTLGLFARFLERGRIVASLCARCPLGFSGVIIIILA